ncbi:MAG TPA: hypothetical protein VGM54_09445 [Chthoniobacter sp.]
MQSAISEMQSFSTARLITVVILLLALPVVVFYESANFALSFLFTARPTWVVVLFASEVTLACGFLLLFSLRAFAHRFSPDFVPRHIRFWLATLNARNWLFATLVFLLIAPCAFVEGEIPQVSGEILKGIPDGTNLYASAKAGSPSAADQLGLNLLQEHQDRPAAKLFQMAAKRGLADAKYHLAFMYLASRGGLTGGESKATQWYAEAIRPPAPPPPTVGESVPTTRRDSVLRLIIHDVEKGYTISGKSSLQSPGGSSYGHDSHFHYERFRLIAIREDGFEITLWRAEERAVRQANVFFRFGEITKANAIGWEVSGKFH